MGLNIRGVEYHIEHEQRGGGQTVVLLHGFTGSTRTWDSTADELSGCNVLTVDLLGHGKTEAPDDPARYAMAEQLADLDELFSQLNLNCIVLLGYSMGGRVALAYACEYPERLRGLILESASPGLPEAEERKARQQADASLAERITSSGIASFVDHWEGIPLFKSQRALPEDVRQRIREERLAQSPQGLANSLTGMGTGSQLSYWHALEALTLPVLLLTGTLDPKFEGIAKRMIPLLQSVRHESVESGHAIHVEKPQEFATIIKKYISSL